jgi:hypothetical protein
MADPNFFQKFFWFSPRLFVPLQAEKEKAWKKLH